MKGHQTFTVRKHSQNATRVEHINGNQYWTTKKFDVPENTKISLFVSELNSENKTIDANKLPELIKRGFGEEIKWNYDQTDIVIEDGFELSW